MHASSEVPSCAKTSAMAFVPVAPLPCSHRHAQQQRCVTMSTGGGRQTRRALLLEFAAYTAATLAGVPQSLAAVNFDIDRFGDKELKVSAINSTYETRRMRVPVSLTGAQGVRDALSYDANTNEGGPNGSLRFELEDSSNADVRAAAAAIADIRKLQREDMSFADTCAFAGATAIEVAGGPRIKVQLGREDAPVPDAPGKGRLFTSTATASELYSCFENAGLQPARDIVLIHGAVGALNAIAKARLEVLAREDDEMDEEDVTYGRVTGGKRGAVLVATNVSDLTLGGAKFSNQYLKALLKRDAKELGAMDATILQSDEMKAEVAKYAGSNSKFINDLGDLFQRVTLLGSSYESLKLEDK